MTKKVSVIGSGAMGTICALILAENGFDVMMYSRRQSQTDMLCDDRENKKYLPGIPLPENIQFTSNIDQLFSDATFAVSGIPCKFLSKMLQSFKAVITKQIPIVSITKGIENDTLLRPTEIIEKILGPRKVAIFSGPNIAKEMAQKLLTTGTLVSADTAFATDMQHAFSTPWLRTYTNNDCIGVELAGATKNIIAIAAGVIDGLKSGDNAKAALLTRGLVEISRLGTVMGAKDETFRGLTGMGDLVTTCISPCGRNRSFGELLASGLSADQAIAKITGQVEGINTVKSVVQLAKKHQVEMPIAQAVNDILFNGKELNCAIAELMTRSLKSEMH